MIINQIEGDAAGASDERESRLFPDPDHKNCKITSHAMTSDFLIYGTSVSSIN